MKLVHFRRDIANTRRLLQAGVILIIQISLVNCSPVRVLPSAGTITTPSTQSPTSSPAITTESMLPSFQPPFGGDSIEIVKSVKQDLVKRFGVSLDDITVLTIIREEFSNNAFYCRVTKDRITRDDPPAVISGFIILLGVSGNRYEYHTSGQTIVFCRDVT